MLLICSLLAAASYYDEGKNFATMLQEKAKKELKNEVVAIKPSNPSPILPAQSTQKKCVTTLPDAPEDPSIFVFASFSMPETAWLSLSEELVKSRGVFILRGLPKNSFKELAKRLYDLRKKGMKATVQVDPRLFSRYNIQTVPSFIITENDHFKKLAGNVSLTFALEKLRGSSP
jgi:conjugal transfer pilus assembly protein TrbC